MNVIEFIREKRDNLQQNVNVEFIARLEPKLRGLSDMISSKLVNTLNNPWISRFHLLDEHTKEEDQPLAPEVEKVYTELKQQLGLETHVGEWHTIDQAAINQFAEVTGDKQWIHTNPERAAQESPFKTTIAHGFFTLSLIPMLTDTVNPDHNPYPDARMVVNYGLNQVRFPFPVRSGSRVRARTKLVGLKPLKRSIEVVSEISIEVENSSRPACVAETVLRLYF